LVGQLTSWPFFILKEQLCVLRTLESIPPKKNLLVLSEVEVKLSAGVLAAPTGGECSS